MKDQLFSSINNSIATSHQNLKWLPNNIMYLARTGSKCYNCHTEDSDDDFKGVCFAPRSIYLGFNSEFKQAELSKDFVIFELKKFLKLTADCNPNMIELLWLRNEDQIFISPLMEIILNNKNLFLSKKIYYTMRGYAYSQIKRIKTHRSWLLNPVKEKPTRKDFSLPERSVISEDNLQAIKAEVKKEIDKLNFKFLDDLSPSHREGIIENVNNMIMLLKITEEKLFEGAALKIGVDSNVLEILKKEKAYDAALLHYNQYIEWKNTRNPKRAALEEKFGYDCKHAYHVMRLLMMCEEALNSNTIKVFRDDRDFFIDIRNGKYSYDELMDLASKKEEECSIAFNKSKLPNAANYSKIDQICIDILGKIL